MKVGPWQSGYLGIFGVYLFFLHTALVLMWSLERRPHALDFYIRRIFRIFPLAWFALLVALVFRMPLSGTPNDFFQLQGITGRRVLVDALLIGNFFPYRQYLNVMWTLPLEIQMYLVLPALFYFVQRERARWPLLLFWALTVAYCLAHPGGFDLPQSIPLFLSGVIAYAGYQHPRSRFPAWTLAVLILVLLAASMYRPDIRIAWPAILVLGLALPYIHQTRVVWLQQLGHTVARYSFGIYLFHSMALVIGVHLMPHASRWVQLPVVFLVICVASYAGYRWIEKPMIDRGAKLAGRLEVKYEKALA